ncbi:hypothetical protein PL79_012355 [Burkholderia sp. USMB20]|nr:hypothetical protein PL79_012355 [Burkholderia sp. USMB20]
MDRVGIDARDSSGDGHRQPFETKRAAPRGRRGEAGATAGEPSIIRRAARRRSARTVLAADRGGCLLARRCGIATLKS